MFAGNATRPDLCVSLMLQTLRMTTPVPRCSQYFRKQGENLARAGRVPFQPNAEISPATCRETDSHSGLLLGNHLGELIEIDRSSMIAFDDLENRLL